MKTKRWPIGKKCSVALLALALLAGLGCAHRELTAPCADYKAAAFPEAASPRTIPCERPLQMQRPPWVIASQPAAPSLTGG